jgi:hypothetical protein
MVILSPSDEDGRRISTTSATVYELGILRRTEFTSYHRARMRYFNTDSPLAFTGTLNCAANASVFFAS